MSVNEPASTGQMVTAYQDACAAAPGHLLFYRVGQFYEVLYDDAGKVSRTLGVQLTRRRQANAPDIPMCGIPAGAFQGFAARLLSAGFKIAVSEQPLAAGEPRLLRTLSPATSVDDDVLLPSEANNLVVCHASQDAVGLAWIDLSTGEASLCRVSLDGVGPALARASPREILISRWPDGSEALAIAVRSSGAPYSDLRAEPVSGDDAMRVLSDAYGDRHHQLIQGCSPIELTALASLLEYVRTTTGQLPAGLLPFRRAIASSTMEIDTPTLRGLEVLTSPTGKDGSLLSVLDRTSTAAGTRLLARQLAAPLTNPETIKRRLAMVRLFVSNPQLRSDCQDNLGRLPDVLRASGKMSLRSAGPRDLAQIRDGLETAGRLVLLLRGLPEPIPGLVSVQRDLETAISGACANLENLLRAAVIQQPPTTVTELGFVVPGYDARLDRSRTDLVAANAAIQALQAQYVAATGLKGLRIRTNTVVGYHVEVAAAAASSLDSSFKLRQGLASTARFSTEQLTLLAARLEEATSATEAAEAAIFSKLVIAVMECRDDIARIAHAAAALDLVAGLAQAAAEGLWVEPDLVEGSGLWIEAGRHPVAERLLENQGRSFVPNDCRMEDDERLWLLTGPNMAGKSTFLRQVALIILMAQVGSFVPAKAARIGIVDKLFSRIGASDDLAAGRSTFMVEMLETAAIMNQATSRSFVILDEVGRGTSTHDGLSIAQACMEYLHDTVRCRTLFATHFHELGDTSDAMPAAVSMAMNATAGDHGDLFTFEIAPGHAKRSYGLKIASLAGMPPAILNRAEHLLEQHQKS